MEMFSLFSESRKSLIHFDNSFVAEFLGKANNLFHAFNIRTRLLFLYVS